MKKFLLSLVALMAIGVSVMADDVTVADVEIPQGGTNYIQLYIENAGSTIYRDFGFTFDLPAGISRGDIAAGDNLPEAAAILPGGQTLVMCVPDEEAITAGTAKVEDYYITKSGVLLNIMLTASSELEEGTTLEAQLKEFEIAGNDGQAAIRKNITFNITIGPARIILDENSPFAPTASGKFDVLVKRTFKANQWSTICMPFAINATILKAAFGEDATYELAQLENFETTKSGDDITGITVNFKSVAGAKAGTPCIIKVNKDISDFTLTQVTLNTSNSTVLDQTETDEETFEDVTIWAMTGTYVAQTTVPDKSLFLSGNNFWYSTGATKMKGYRAYITLKDKLSGIDSEEAGVKFNYVIDNTPTSINDIDFVAAPEGVFTIDGKKMNNDVTKLPKGVYIIDGKKVAIK